LRVSPLLLAFLAWPATAWAAAPGRWEVIGPAVADTDAAGMVRTLDGRVHLVWTTPAPAGATLRETVLGRDGGVARSVDVVTGWSGVSPAAVLLGVGGAGLDAYFAGDDGAGRHGVFRASTAGGGGVWTVRPDRVATTPWPFASSGIAAAAIGIGGDQVVATWVGADGCPVVFDPAATEPLGPPCGATEAGVGVDFATAAAVLAWTSTAPGAAGLWYVARDDLGPPRRVPGSGGTDGDGVQQVVPAAQRTAITGRPGFAGVWIGYPAGWPKATAVRVFRVGAGRFATLAAGQGASRSHVVLAADPEGRLWALWEETVGAGARLVARRSNAAVTTWGAPVAIPLPARVTAVGSLVASADERVLDVVLNGSGGGLPATLLHTRMQPGIAIAGLPTRHRPGRLVLRLRLADAGRPLGGVVVQAAGVSARSDAHGRATLRLVRRRRGVLTVTATAPGYARAAATIRIG
jgi:hypothetical protein